VCFQQAYRGLLRFLQERKVGFEVVEEIAPAVVAGQPRGHLPIMTRYPSEAADTSELRPAPAYALGSRSLTMSCHVVL
jgi:hypothetical protein